MGKARPGAAPTEVFGEVVRLPQADVRKPRRSSAMKKGGGGGGGGGAVTGQTVSTAKSRGHAASQLTSCRFFVFLPVCAAFSLLQLYLLVQ